jgi:hypothetical protein
MSALTTPRTRHDRIAQMGRQHTHQPITTLPGDAQLMAMLQQLDQQQTLHTLSVEVCMTQPACSNCPSKNHCPFES